MEEYFLICFEKTTKAVAVIRSISEDEAISKYASNGNGCLQEENGILYYKMPKSDYRLYALNNNYTNKEATQ